MRRELGYVGIFFFFLQPRAGNRNKNLLLLSENQISQGIENFSVGRCKTGLPEIIPLTMHLSYLRPESCDFTEKLLGVAAV